MDIQESRLSVAVVVATFNGARFIEEQLESIRRQSLQPQRVIIRDDGSSDGTQEIVTDYISSHGLLNWDFRENDRNKGFTANFLDAAIEAQQEIVFFCDQDDVWLASKIENALRVFDAYTDCIAVLCNSDLINADGIRMRKSRFERKRVGKHATRVPLDEQVSSMVSSGHLLSIKSGLVHEVSQYIKDNDMTYDSSLGIIAAAKGGLFRSNTVDVLHRIHAFNTSKPTYGIASRISDKERYLEGRRFQLKILKNSRGLIDKSIDSITLERYDQEIKCREESLRAMQERRLKPLLSSLIRRSKMKNTRIEFANLVVAILFRQIINA